MFRRRGVTLTKALLTAVCMLAAPLTQAISVGNLTFSLPDAPRDKCALSCAINGIHAAFHYLKKNYISGSVMTVPTG